MRFGLMDVFFSFHLKSTSYEIKNALRRLHMYEKAAAVQNRSKASGG